MIRAILSFLGTIPLGYLLGALIGLVAMPDKAYFIPPAAVVALAGAIVCPLFYILTLAVMANLPQKIVQPPEVDRSFLKRSFFITIVASIVLLIAFAVWLKQRN